MANLLGLNIDQIINQSNEQIQEHFADVGTAYLFTYRFLGYNLLTQSIKSKLTDENKKEYVDKIIKVVYSIDSELYKRKQLKSPKTDLIESLEANKYPVPKYLKNSSANATANSNTGTPSDTSGNTVAQNVVDDFKANDFTVDERVVQSLGFFLGFGVGFKMKLKKESDRVFYVLGLALAGLFITMASSYLLKNKQKS